MGLGVDGEVELDIPPLLPVLALHPAAGLVDADAGGVDGDGDGLVRLLEVAVWVDGLAEDPSSEAGVVAGGHVGYEGVEGSGESFELAVGEAVEVADGCEELDVCCWIGCRGVLSCACSWFLVLFCGSPGGRGPG